MIPRYRLLAERLKSELESLARIVERAENALSRAADQPQDKQFFVASAAFDLHGFYSGLERLFEIVAGDVDDNRPSGPNWHRDLLAQMSLAVPEVRPAVLSSDALSALSEYLEFRHVVRNVYTFNLKTERVTELVQGLRPAFELAQRDLLAFVQFLDDLSKADEEADEQP